jgi:hypothetical protein
MVQNLHALLAWQLLEDAPEMQKDIEIAYPFTFLLFLLSLLLGLLDYDDVARLAITGWLRSLLHRFRASRRE